MKKKYTYCLIFSLCSFCFINGFTQNIAIGYSSRFILNKSMSFSCEPELKFENIDYFAYQSASVTGAYRYKWAKTISSEFGYRFLHSYKASDDIDIFKNRVHADLSIKIPQQEFTFEYRARLQSNVASNYATYTVRNKFECILTNYAVISPFIFAEIYSNTHFNEFVKGKIQIGISHSMQKKLEFEEYISVETKIKNRKAHSSYEIGICIKQKFK